MVPGTIKNKKVVKRLSIDIDRVFKETLKYLKCAPKTKRKEIGQFFTSMETAKFMASMFSDPHKENLSILDAGAGSGILTAAIVNRLQNSDVKHIQITCYEISQNILPLLKNTLAYLKNCSAISLDYKIREENYITTQYDDFNTTLFADPNAPKYDYIIGNPPYKKISKNAVEAVAMASVCYGVPNLYFLFAAMSLFNLDKDGEMVYIIPRSWTSGAYFKNFRDYLLHEGIIKQMHLFVSRNKVFEAERILQETTIIRIVKSGDRDFVKITSSNSNGDFEDISTIEVPYNHIVSTYKTIFLVTNDDELQILKILSKWTNTLPILGFKMRTGLTVNYRNMECLRNETSEDTVPLFYPQHIKDGRVIFPLHTGDEYITTEKSGLIQKNKNYLFVKRFTTKEEKKRLQCGIYLSSDFSEYSSISTQNKVNFIETLNFEMSKELVYGLYVLFNSTIYDLYYRILNGSTQVNSTEVNAMPVPTLNEIERLGVALLEKNDLSTCACDEVLEVLIKE